MLFQHKVNLMLKRLFLILLIISFGFIPRVPPLRFSYLSVYLEGILITPLFSVFQVFYRFHAKAAK